MILYVNGDSNSAGTGLKDITQSWPQLLAKRLGYTLVNDAGPGASNPRILRVTNLKKIDPDNTFVIIGWTSWEREEWEFNGRYYDVNSGGHTTLPPELELKYKEWVAEQNSAQQAIKSKDAHDYLYLLHQKLANQKIKHLFFNALMPFQHNLLDPVHKDWGKNYLGPYDNELSYYWYLKNHGWQTDSRNHYAEDAQAIWANLLYNYIQENQIL